LNARAQTMYLTKKSLQIPLTYINAPIVATLSS